MQRQSIATLPKFPSFDDCLILKTLKKVFGSSSKTGLPSYEYVVSRTLADVKEALPLLNKRPFVELSYDYLQAVEASLPAGVCRYMLIYKEGRPVLFSYAQLFTLTSKNFRLEKNAGCVKSILKLFLDLKKIKVLMTGNALRTDTSCCCYDSTMVNADEVAELISAGAEKIADEENVTAVILKDMPYSMVVRSWLAEQGYNTPWADAVMELTLPEQWTNMNDYVAALSRKYKTRANKILDAGKDLEFRVMGLDEVRAYDAQIDRLFNNVLANQSFRLTTVAPHHFSSMKQVYGDGFEVFGLFKEGALSGFCSAFISADTYELYYAGIDYNLNTEYQLYFNILFAGLARAIELKKSRLVLGRTSFDAKASIGAKPVELPYFIKIANLPQGVTNWFINYFSGMEDGKWKMRNPLK